ncbi:MAG: protein-(glutamine-N5) methyltransferase, release factor-specific, partial [Erysipelotrichaceae bacterium]|nr:protein-(glutamine-N5) methyltransferase, release factor-specific [Erysipelotrichaceae bacterium]
QFYRIILSEAHKVIKERSMLAFEIGYQQKDDILALAEQYFPSQRKEVIKDLNGKDRMLFIYVNLKR